MSRRWNRWLLASVFILLGLSLWTPPEVQASWWNKNYRYGIFPRKLNNFKERNGIKRETRRIVLSLIKKLND